MMVAVIVVVTLVEMVSIGYSDNGCDRSGDGSGSGYWLL